MTTAPYEPRLQIKESDLQTLEKLVPLLVDAAVGNKPNNEKSETLCNLLAAQRVLSDVRWHYPQDRLDRMAPTTINEPSTGLAQ